MSHFTTFFSGRYKLIGGSYIYIHFYLILRVIPVSGTVQLWRLPFPETNLPQIHLTHVRTPREGTWNCVQWSTTGRSFRGVLDLGRVDWPVLNRSDVICLPPDRHTFRPSPQSPSQVRGREYHLKRTVGSTTLPFSVWSPMRSLRNRPSLPTPRR